jgi:site-specific recombinase XerC
MLIDTGMRASELLSVKLSDLDLDPGGGHWLGQGRRPRSCPFDSKAAPPWIGICGLGPGTPTRPATRCGWAGWDR